MEMQLERLDMTSRMHDEFNQAEECNECVVEHDITDLMHQCDQTDESKGSIVVSEDKVVRRHECPKTRMSLSKDNGVG